jgi:uncharacterized membrane protein
VSLAQQAAGTIEMIRAVGDTLVEGDVVLQVRGGAARLPEERLLGAVQLARERTFEQDPSFRSAFWSMPPSRRSRRGSMIDAAVQTIDQLEDLLRRLGRCDLDVGRVCDQSGALRLVFPTPDWEDYLAIAFDEIRQYGSSSVQVMRMRSALVGLLNFHCRERTAEKQCVNIFSTLTMASRSRPWTLRTVEWPARKAGDRPHPPEKGAG